MISVPSLVVAASLRSPVRAVTVGDGSVHSPFAATNTSNESPSHRIRRGTICQPRDRGSGVFQDLSRQSVLGSARSRDVSGVGAFEFREVFGAGFEWSGFGRLPWHDHALTTVPMTLHSEPREPTETSTLMVGNTGFSASGNHRVRFGNSQKNYSTPRDEVLSVAVGGASVAVVPLGQEIQELAVPVADWSR